MLIASRFLECEEKVTTSLKLGVSSKITANMGSVAVVCINQLHLVDKLFFFLIVGKFKKIFSMYALYIIER